jgi:tetratricopeptide (TPR) repeat protein
MKTSLGKLVIALLLPSLLFSFTCFAHQTLTVPDEYPTIQAAIDAAQPGDTVYVRAGEYTESIAISKPLNLVGEDCTWVILQPPDSGKDVIKIAITTGDVTIAGVKVAGGVYGIYVNGEKGTHVAISNVIASDNRYGIAVFGEGSLSLKYSFVIDNQEIGLWLSNASAAVADTEVLWGGTGILIGSESDVTLEHNLVGYCMWGIDTYTTTCGWTIGEASFHGKVCGADNRVTPVSGTCPDYPGEPWPEGFLDVDWGEAVYEAGRADNLGVDLYGLQDYEGALAEYEAGLVFLEEASFPLLRAYFNHDIGNVYCDLGLYEQALEKYRIALAVYEARRMDYDIQTISENITNIGDVYAQLGYYEEALAVYVVALSSYQRLGMVVDVAKLHVKVGSILDELGRYAEALTSYKDALAVYIAREMEIETAVVHNSMGVVYTKLAHYREALTSYKDALATYLARGMELEATKVSENVGVVYWYLGRYEEALTIYETALAFYKVRGMEVEVAGVCGNMGIVYRNLGRYEEALTSHETALSIYIERKMEVNIAKTHVNIGVVYDELGRYEDALGAYKLARAIYAEKKMKVNVAKTHVNIGVVYGELGRYEDAFESYQSARAVFASHGMDADVAVIDQNIGNVYRHLGRYKEALSSYKKALVLLDMTLPVAGMAYSYPATRWMILNNMGICYEAMEQWDEAREAYEGSIAVIESLRGYLKSEELKTAWQERTRDVYERLIKLLIDQGQGTSAFTYAERCRARTFLDALYQGSIAPNQLISPEAGISSGAVDPIAIDQAVADARDSLQGNEAVLEYMVTDSGVYLWVITKETISDPIFIEYEREQLMNDVVSLRKSLESDPPDQITMTELLSSFYNKLVKKSLAKLPDGVDTLILIPSGPLWYLPFSALIMTDQDGVPSGGLGTRSPYLVEKFILAYLPSLASLSSLTKGGAEAAGGVRLLALADPELSPDQLREGEGSKCGEEKPLERYEQLVAACQDFADLLVGKEQEEQCVYAGKEAQEVRAHEETGRQVVVYAAHGQFNPYVPLQSKLLLAPGGKAANLQTDSRVLDGNYHAWETLLTDYRGTELVVLAACETLLPHLRDMQGALAVLSDQECDQVELTPQQLEQIVVGDEVVGLARAFLSSGAEAVLGTLWLANPTAIGKLLMSMAEYHKEGDTWVQALTKAQRELIKGNTFKNPWFWAPYQLIGRWR